MLGAGSGDPTRVQGDEGMSQQSAPIQVFCSYAPEDEALYQELEKHLSVLQHQHLIAPWHSRLTLAGTDWTQDVDTHLRSPTLILVLISADLLASQYGYGVELRQALHRHEVGQARVIPILLRKVDWQGEPIARLAALPTTGQPVTSWPNQDEAFADVVAGIRRAISDLSQPASLASPSTLLPIWNVPYPRNPVFTGREDLLAQLAQTLQPGQAMALTQAAQAISGLGGIGKTQLAVEYAYRHQSDYQAVLWARAESTEALTSSCITLAELLDLPQKQEPDQTKVVAAVQQWLRTQMGWLLILDNADDLTVVRSFLPPVYGGHVLLTTRAQAMGRLAQRLNVDTLPPEQGALLLLRRAGWLASAASLDQASPADRTRAQAITHELGGLPLALDQAGAYIEETGCSLADYQQHRAELLKERRGQVPDHPESVATTWSLAFQRVEQAQPAAADLLRLCAFLAPEAIPEELLT
jgi:hypothetical protein